MRSATSKIRRLIAFMLIALLTCATLAVSVLADGADVYEQNQQLRAEKFAALGNIQNQNIATTTGTRVNSLLLDYYKKLNDVGTEPETALDKRETRDLIELLYTQGIATNDVAWIYYTHVDSFVGESRDNVKAAHDALQTQIAEHTNASVLDALINAPYADGGLCAQMYCAVFGQKLDDLLVDTDSPAVKAKIAAAKLELQGCTDFSLESDQFEKILADATFAVEVQREQDKALEQLDGAFGILCPGADLEANDNYLSAKAIDDDSTDTVAKMNEILERALLAQLSDMKSDKYVKEYLEALSQIIAAEFDAAQSENRVALIVPLLGEHEMDIYRASAKDAIRNYLIEKGIADADEMVELESDYNTATTGVIDACVDKQSVDFEVKRAKMRADVYDVYADAEQLIASGAGDADDLAEAKKLYREHDDLLVTATPEYIDDRYAKAIEVLEVFIFEIKHSDILSKVNGGAVSIADKEAIKRALEDAKKLSDAAKESLYLQIKSLADKYIEITKQEIDAALGSTGLNKTYALELKDIASHLTLSGDPEKLEQDIDALFESAESLVGKAEQIRRLLDAYDAIVAEQDFASFPQSVKNSILKNTTDASDAIVESDASLSEHAKLATDAIAQIHREQAKARIDLKCDQRNDLGSAAKERIEQIISAAHAQIDASSDIGEIKTLTEDAIFDIQKEFDVNDLSVFANGIQSQIASDANLTDAQKNALAQRLASTFEAGAQSIRAAATEQQRQQRIVDARANIDALSDEAELKSQTMREGAQNMAQANAAADALTYLDDAQRAAIKAQIKSAYDTLSSFLVDQTNPDLIAAAGQTAAEAMNEAIAQGQLDNGAAKQQQVSAATEQINQKFEQAAAQIDALTCLSQDRKDEFKAALTAKKDASLASLATVTGTASVNSVLSGANSAFSTVVEQAKAADASARANQKDSAKSRIEQEIIDADNAIAALTYLDSAQVAGFKVKTQKVLDDARAALAAADSTEQISRALDDARAQLALVLAEAQIQNLDNAKAAAIAELTAGKNNIDTTVDGFKYLDGEPKARLKGEAAAILAAAKDEIQSAGDVETVEKKRNNASDALDSKLDEALLAEDLACVDKLLPVIIILGIIGVGEAVAIAVLLSKRKKIGLAAFVPLSPIGRIVPAALKLGATDAWTLTVALAVADVIMGIIVVCLAVQLARSGDDRTDEELEEQMTEALIGMQDEDWDEIPVGAVALSDLSDDLYIADEEENDQADEETDEVEETEADEEVEPTEESDLFGTPIVLEELFDAPTEPEIEPEPEAATPEVKPEVVTPAAPVVRARRFRRRARAVINIDTLDAHFGAGETVTLDALKAKGLIGRRVCYVKVLGRGYINKPLTVVAQAFSASAIREIVKKNSGVAIIDTKDAKDAGDAGDAKDAI